MGSSADALVKTFLILRKDCFPWKFFVKRKFIDYFHTMRSHGEALVTPLDNRLPHFMESEYPLPPSQEPTTGHDLEAVE